MYIYDIDIYLFEEAFDLKYKQVLNKILKIN